MEITQEHQDNDPICMGFIKRTDEIFMAYDDWSLKYPEESEYSDAADSLLAFLNNDKLPERQELSVNEHLGAAVTVLQMMRGEPRQGIGMQLAEYILEVDQPILKENKDILTFLQAEIIFETAKERVAKEVGTITEVIELCFLAIDIHESNGTNLPTTIILHYVRNLAASPEDEVRLAVLNGLNQMLQSGKGPLETRDKDLKKQIAQRAIASLCLGEEVTSNAFWGLMQMTNGQVFNVISWFSSAELLYLGRHMDDLNELADQLYGTMELKEKPSSHLKLDLLEAMDFVEEVATDGQPITKVLFDQYVNHKLLLASTQFPVKSRVLGLSKSFSLDGIRESIPEDTLLLYLYKLVTDKQALIAFTVAFTNEGMQFYATAAGEKTPWMPTDPLDMYVLMAREFIRKKDNEKAEGVFQQVSTVFYSQAKSILEPYYKAGKRHLCIVPHEGLHAFPFHLIRMDGELLADHWNISYLPQPGLLMDYKPKNANKREGLGVYGVDFSWDLEWGAIPETIAEAKAIAQAFDTEPYLNEDVNIKNVFKGLHTYKYIHFSSHGMMDHEAPNLHFIQLHRGNHHQDRLYAYQILMMDMRGVELVTLSACETALGRFDKEGNMRGLAASFLQAGAESIIGTLWEVKSDTAAFFFTELYQLLKQGVNKSDAFYQTQKLTKEKFPNYEDWGAFYFTGRWWERPPKPGDRYSVSGMPGHTYSHPTHIMQNPPKGVKTDMVIEGSDGSRYSIEHPKIEAHSFNPWD